MYAVTYLIKNTFCLFILYVLLRRKQSTMDHSLGTRLFEVLICAVMVYAFLDLILGLQENDAIVLSWTMIGFLNILYFDMSYLVCFIVFSMGNTRQNPVYYMTQKSLYCVRYRL